MLKIDFHIHTIHSGHAYGTFYDVIGEAARKKMLAIAITDHGPDLQGGPNQMHFGSGTRAPKEHEGVRILWGCEANLLDIDGTIDLSEKYLRKLDLLIVGFHRESSYKDLGNENNTQAIIRCFERYRPHIFSHPSRIYCEYDPEAVIKAAIENDVLLEVNLFSLFKIKRGDSNERFDILKQMVDICRKNKVKVIVNSDSHFIHEIGDDSLLDEFKPKLGLTDDMIINNYPDELLDRIRKQKERWQE